MKKNNRYNRREIMKRAWELFRNGSTPMRKDFGLCLSKAWKEAKKAVKKASFFKEVTVYVKGKRLTVDLSDGAVFGNTYPVKDELKKTWGLKWSPVDKCWTGTDDQLRELCFYCEFK